MPLEVDNAKALEQAPPPASVLEAWHPGATNPSDQLSLAPGSTTKPDLATQNLVDQNVIPDLKLSGHPAEVTQLPQPAAPKDWTVAVDLAESIAPHVGNEAGGGSERLLPELEAMAKETKGKSVNILVHAERLIDEDGKLCQQADMFTTGECMHDALERDSKQAVTESYFIHDGKIDRLPDANYADAGSDVTALLKEANQIAPAKNLGLILNAHGGGADGISANLGYVSLEDEMGAISKGLDGSGHAKLDLLDFDSCDMGVADVLAQSSKLAKDLVASPAVEYANTKNDAQNEVQELRTLLGNSKQSGLEWGESMVAQARTGGNGAGYEGGTQALANYDLAGYDSFKDNLNRFGSALGATADDSGNMKQIAADIDKTHAFETGKDAMDLSKRDLQSFAQTILADSQAHKFSGDTKPLEDASSALLQSMDSLVTAKYGEEMHGNDKLGELAVYLPGNEVLDSYTLAQGFSPLHKISKNLKEDVNSNFTREGLPDTMQSVNYELDLLPVKTKADYPDETRKILDARDALGKSNSFDQYHQNIRNLEQAVTAADQGPMGAQITDRLHDLAKSHQKENLKEATINLAPDWDQFIRQVQSQAK